MAEKNEDLFDSKFLKKLEMLGVVARRVFAGAARGERRSTKRGLSVEFADYREYSHGDDLRYVDWNAVARLDHFFLKLFVEEEDLFVYILLDATMSMGFGEPAKLRYARQICAALSYIALTSLDRVAIEVLPVERELRMPVTRGKQNIFKVFNFLRDIRADGRVALNDALETFAKRTRKPGLVILISDLMDEEGMSRGVDFLRYRKFQPVVIQVLTPEEIEPPDRGDWRMVDSETGGYVDISMTRAAIDGYRRRLNAFLEYVETFSRRRNIPYLRAVTNTPFEDLMLRYLRQASIVA
ncbi:MAG: DUF58 domain-containing protein [Planctomycetota bacterium]